MNPQDPESGKDTVHCKEALAEIYLLLDRECSPERDAELRRHIEDCPPCLEAYGIDVVLKELIARKCGGDLAPAQLKQKLRASIHQRVNVSIEHTEVRAENRD
ncbi:mycothiol system anti-sigma-R factor [Amycolatopsis pithecellobii]|uniref:Mycothiol system anti-sigma-R factor n=1 Tax=Amycolatopsis pithecellobii TaxID=664692 RepID=A0A6N7Z9U3_9PSEU|nr:mycothiol system anti-sigma-R factor [Amycolatopsis pithecellobii]MTD58489.1 mycothiol system anti-sigma-R factor [Amycolatopsis pithecellobii]